MRKRRAFLMNSTVILLLIPLMLLLATYEDVSSQIIMSQSERTQVERTYRTVSYVEMDFQRTLEISGKRAIVTIVDYIANTRNFLDPSDPNGMANATIRDLILYGQSGSIPSNYSERLMRDQTVLGWLGNMSRELERQGYELRIANKTLDEIRAMSSSERSNFLRSNIELTVAPLDAFRIVIRAKIKDVSISDVSGKVVYTGPIPRENYVYSIISIENLEDPLFPALSYGRYSRSIEPCNYTFPEIIDRPIKSLYGNGRSQDDHVLGKYSSTAGDSGHIFYGNAYPGDGADGYVLRSGDIASISSPVIVNTTLNGVPISPLEVFNDDDIGVLVFGNVSATTHWCNYDYKWRVNITIPSYADGSLVLLKIPTSTFPNIYHTDDTASMVIYEKSDTACVSVPFWIEYWGTSYVWIWIKTSGTDYTVYFTDNPSYATDGYDKQNLFWLIDTFNDPTLTPVLWNNLSNAYLDGNGHLVVPAGTKKLALQTVNTIDGQFFVRFRMKPGDTAQDFDGGVETEFNYTKNVLKVVVNYDGPQLDSYTDIQIPIDLSAANVSGINADPITNRAEIKVYSDKDLQNEIPFWIERWDPAGARVWVKTDLTYVGSSGGTYQYTATVYIEYNTDTLTRGDGREVFEFFDDFENPSEWGLWDDYRNGNLSITSIYVHDGNYAMSKLLNNDPNGGYRPIGKTLGRGIILEYWDYRINTSGGKLDRVGVIDNNGNGYGAMFRPDKGDVGIDVRNGYGGNLQRTSGSTYGINFWYFVRFEIKTDGTLHVEVYDEDGNLMGSYTRSDSTYDTFTRVYIFGGHDYAVDDIRIRKYLDESYLSYSVTVPQYTERVEFIDDNPGFSDHNGDTLAILENWGNSLASDNPTVLNDYHRYQAVFDPGVGGVDFEFADVDSSFRSTTASVNREPETPAKVGIVIDGQTDAYFDWIVIGEMPYYTTDSITSTGVEEAPASTSEYNSRAYDLQPLISCIIDQKYFGTYAGVSFFERLENSRANHAKYFQLAKEMQDELGMKYGGEYYPIGLVSFMVPNADYDRKLFDIFNNFGISIEEGQSSVDYYFLNYYFGSMAKTPGYRVWGISYGTSALTGDLSVVPFFLDNQTAAAILGPTGAEDLLKR
ncbi:DUF2341 domain-containing protein [Thermococcus sp. 5-4]|uniref:DUF2341 domain-containing protein n=1 Tax=Thermococcus sp. 5-4 TaxID=2008440 RepID=UPI000B4A425C|nr:DUF2341 domain-containing protein [Thermococcus sp. 5-4]ASA76783.1 hypothetical protein CDI07_00200 [Thermococcus sp. 5-4]